MPPNITKKPAFAFWSAVGGIAAVGLFCALPLVAQRSRGDASKHRMERLDQEEAARRLEGFRRQRLQGDYVFEFQLEYKPRRAATVRYDGIMWGAWNEQGPLTRFKVFLPVDPDVDLPPASIELVAQNGADPSVWLRRSATGAFEPVEGEALFEPLLPGLGYSVFDLQMPFIYWKDFIYEGPSLVGVTRVGQWFLMLPPEGSASAARGIKGVRVALDDTYNALWRVEVVGHDDAARSRFAVESFKKVQEQYIVKRITLTNYPAKNRTTFNVRDASVGLQLDPALFDVSAKPDLKRALTPAATSPETTPLW